MPAPRLSASVLLTRGRGRDLEVLLVERSKKLRFYGGFWALPGGAIDDSDRGPDDEPADRAYLRCAARELFEETDVLVGPLLEAVGPDVREAARAELLAEAGAPLWSERATDATGYLDALRPVCRITTPPFAPRRFETLFVHAELPDGEELGELSGELSDGCFWRPADAMRAWRSGDLLLVPPVLFLVECLDQHGLDEFFPRAAEAAAAVESGRLHNVRNSPGVFMAALRTPTLPPATTTNCYLVGDERVYVVDPATYEESEQERLFERMDAWIADGRRFEGVLVTHHHHDHVGAVAATSRRYDLPVHAHPLTLDRLPEGFRRGRALEDGDELELGTSPDGREGWRLRALHTPGHDRGHLAFVENRYRAAIVGDMVSTVSTIVIDPPEGHLATYLASLRRLDDEGIGMLYPAHGPAFPDGPALLRRYLAHRAQREAALVKALEVGPKEPAELVPLVYTDVSEGLWPIAERSLLAGLEKLEEEGRARRTDAGWLAAS